jgi:chromosome segregation ATPase
MSQLENIVQELNGNIKKITDNISILKQQLVDKKEEATNIGRDKQVLQGQYDKAAEEKQKLEQAEAVARLAAEEERQKALRLGRDVERSTLELKNVNIEHNKSIAILEQERDELVKAQNQLRTASAAEKAGLAAEVKVKQADVDTAETKLSALQRLQDNVTTDLEQTRAAVISAEEREKAATARITEMEQQVTAATKDLSLVQTQLTDVEGEGKKCMEAITTLNEQIRVLAAQSDPNDDGDAAAAAAAAAAPAAAAPAAAAAAAADVDDDDDDDDPPLLLRKGGKSKRRRRNSRKKKKSRRGGRKSKRKSKRRTKRKSKRKSKRSKKKRRSRRRNN